MEVGSVSSSASLAASTQVRAPAGQDQQALQAQKVQQAKQSEGAQTARAVAESQATEKARLAAEQIRPSVNTSGQMVGQRINVTA